MYRTEEEKKTSHELFFSRQLISWNSVGSKKYTLCLNKHNQRTIKADV
jgi:hypothetical protein